VNLMKALPIVPAKVRPTKQPMGAGASPTAAMLRALTFDEC
jgi:hypothetical protein